MAMSQNSGPGRGFENAATASATSLPSCSMRHVHVVSDRPDPLDAVVNSSTSPSAGELA